MSTSLSESRTWGHPHVREAPIHAIVVLAVPAAESALGSNAGTAVMVERPEEVVGSSLVASLAPPSIGKGTASPRFHVAAIDNESFFVLGLNAAATAAFAVLKGLQGKHGLVSRERSCIGNGALRVATPAVRDEVGRLLFRPQVPFSTPCRGP